MSYWCLNMLEYASMTLNVIEYAGIYQKKNRVLNMSEIWMCLMQYNIRSQYKLLSSYRDRRIENTVKHLRWSVLQKEQCLSSGAQSENSRGKGVWTEICGPRALRYRFPQKYQNKGPRWVTFRNLLLDIVKTTFWMGNLTKIWTQ